MQPQVVYDDRDSHEVTRSELDAMLCDPPPSDQPTFFSRDTWAVRHMRHGARKADWSIVARIAGTQDTVTECTGSHCQTYGGHCAHIDAVDLDVTTNGDVSRRVGVARVLIPDPPGAVAEGRPGAVVAGGIPAPVMGGCPHTWDGCHGLERPPPTILRGREPGKMFRSVYPVFLLHGENSATGATLAPQFDPNPLEHLAGKFYLKLAVLADFHGTVKIVKGAW